MTGPSDGLGLLGAGMSVLAAITVFMVTWIEDRREKARFKRDVKARLRELGLD